MSSVLFCQKKQKSSFTCGLQQKKRHTAMRLSETLPLIQATSMERMVFTMAKRWLRITTRLLGILTLAVICGMAPKSAIAEEFAESAANNGRPILVEEERAWYGTSCTFSDSWSSPRRYYDGENVGIEMSTQSSGTGSFTVQLYKSNRLIGSKAVTKNGFARATWENVGSGEYHFKFVDRSGSRIACSDIAMFSW